MSHYFEALAPQNSQTIFIGRQPQMVFGVQSIGRQTLKNNVVGLAKTAKIFDISVIIITVETDSFSDPTYPELLTVLPEQEILKRTSMNSWSDQSVRDSLAATGCKKVVVTGPWTGVCSIISVLCTMLEDDYEIYMVADASGGISGDTRKYATNHMVQTDVISVTWQQALLGWQRDWTRRDTYDVAMTITKEHPGVYDAGVDCAYIMTYKAPERVIHGERIGPNPAK